MQIRFGLCFDPLWLSYKLTNYCYPFQHRRNWCCASSYLPGTLCVPGPRWYFSMYCSRVRPTLNHQSNGWNLICKSHFHVRHYLLHILLGRVLLFLVHLLIHFLCRDFFHWKFCLFRRHCLHGQQHKYYAFWSGLMKSWQMDRVLEPLYIGNWMLWKMWKSLMIYIGWLLSSTIFWWHNMVC